MKDLELPFLLLLILDFEKKRDFNDNLFFNGFCPLITISLSAHLSKASFNALYLTGFPPGFPDSPFS